MTLPLAKAFERIDQIGFLVDDIHQAVAFWSTNLGVGPFFLMEHASYPHFTYRGVATAPDLSLAFSYVGNLQIELIQQHNDAPSVYTDFRKTSGTGLVHMAQYVQDAMQASAALRAKGAQVIQYGRDDEGIEIMYLDTAFHNGGFIEFISTNEARTARRARMKAAVSSWNGAEPLRSMASL